MPNERGKSACKESQPLMRHRQGWICRSPPTGRNLHPPHGPHGRRNGGGAACRGVPADDVAFCIPKHDVGAPGSQGHAHTLVAGQQPLRWALWLCVADASSLERKRASSILVWGVHGNPCKGTRMTMMGARGYYQIMWCQAGVHGDRQTVSTAKI